MPLPSSPRLRRMIIAVLGSAVALGGVLASASTLGLSGTTLGGGTSLVASCDTVGGVTLKYGHTYVPGVAAGLGQFRTSSVVVSGIDAPCTGKAISVTLKDSAGVSLASGSLASIVGSSATVTFPTLPFANAGAVVGSAVVIAD